jgi:uncharacterized protein YegL
VTSSIVGADALDLALQGNDVMHVVFILDRSGSMSGKEADVIGGFNSYVDELRRNPAGPVGISYLRFDNVVELVWNDVPLADVPRMTPDDYAVRGNTALLDAVAMTVSSIKDVTEHRYVVIVHTDGMENASREWTVERVKTLIEERQARDNWTFAFFGEGVDAWSQAERYGYGAGQRAEYSAARAKDLYMANARVSNVMRSKTMRSSKKFADATSQVMRDAALSDDEIERALKEDDAAGL